MQTESRSVEQRYFSLAEVARWVGISRSSVLRWEESGDFPPRRRLGPNRVGWDREELLAWAESREPVVMKDEANQKPTPNPGIEESDGLPEAGCHACGRVGEDAQGDLEPRGAQGTRRGPP